jgi:uncharacterized membrane-anchored protein YhcB (DUF1043 family)
MNQDARMAWTVAGVLAIVVVILLGALAFYWHQNQPKDLSQVLQNGKTDITQVRNQISIDCKATDADGKKHCADDLQTLSDTLHEFSTNVANSTTTAK